MPAADISLTTFGGLCTEVAPSDLPEGASPLNWDVDYLVGSVKSRDGLQTQLFPALSLKQVTFNPAVWTQGTGAGTNPGNNGYNALNVYLDSDGTTGWAFDQSGTAFGRYNLSSGAVIAQGNLFGASGPGTFMGGPSNLNSIFVQDDQGFYYIWYNDGSGNISLKKSHVGSSASNSFWNGYMILDASWAFPLAATQFQAQYWARSISPAADGNRYYAFINSGNGNEGNFGLYVINVSSMTLVGKYLDTSSGTILFDSCFMDKNGVFWAIYHNHASPTSTFTFVQWNPTNGATGGNLNVTVNSVNLSPFAVGSSGAASLPAAYVASNHSVTLTANSGTNPYTGNLVNVALTGLTVNASVSDNGSLSWSPTTQGWLQDATFLAGVDGSGNIGIAGDTSPTSTTQRGGILNLVVASNLSLARSINITTAINAIGTLTPIGTFVSGGHNLSSPFSSMQYRNGTMVAAYDTGFNESKGSPVYIALLNNPSPSTFDYVKTFEQDNGTVNTLALDASGTLWEENVGQAPGTLTPLTTKILPNTFADSVTQQNEEWICFSDLQKGTDIPRHGSNLDRISQVGPGVGPAVAGASSGTNSYTIAASLNGLTQAAAASDPADPGHFQAVNWSAGPTSTSPGNVLTIFYRQGTPPGPDPHIQTGGGIYISGLSGVFAGLNGTYVVASQGFAVPPGGSGNRWYFTVVTAGTGNAFVGGPDTMTGQYQVTLATLTTTTPANIQVGTQVSIAGAGVAAWDGTWTITANVNGGQYSITNTSLTSGVATYAFTLVSGSNPNVGDLVTVTGCTNGPIVNGTSVFNVINASVSATGAGTFSVLISAANVTSAAETGSAIDSGTIFQFDPGLSMLGLVPPGTSPIFGNSGGGTVSTGGNIGAGVRQAVTFFITRNGYQTAPSPPTVFETTGSANTLTVSNIALGPPDVIARGVAFTGSNGGNFFYIPDPVTITGVGQAITYSSTVINDNITTSATFTFTDAVLLAATAIDIQGNDLFNQIELGSSTWNIAYASRMFYGGENNKIQNLLNTTFDGGYLPQGTAGNLPAGWTVDPTNGSGGTVVTSPIFGNSYYVKNTTGSTAAILGLITQSAYQDFYKVPIILPSFTYSVRLRASCPSGLTTGSLVIDLYSPSLARTFGSYTLPISSMTTSLNLFSGQLLGTAFTTSVQNDLQLRVWASGLANNADWLLDRFEIYPDNQPVLTTELQGSYIDNLEAFDGVTGPLGVGTQNNQPALGAFVNYDILYILKTNSMVSTQDSPGNEPAQWTIREVSNKVGTCGIHAYDYGEEWAVTAHRSGLYIFNGSEPIKISQEIKPTWDTINWQYGYTIWVRNDTVNRRILVGVPMATPNQWLPNASANANPTTPNLVLMLNYKELNTSAELAQRGPLKISYSGKLISWDISRKWSIWQIPSPYADFITRPDGSAPLFFCQANSMITEQIEGLTTDNGASIDALYTTYGFVKAEQEPQFGPVLGDHRKLATYMVMNIDVGGTIIGKVLPNYLTAPSTSVYTIPGGIYETVATENNNLEYPLEISGDRLYVQFETSESGSSFQISELKMTLQKDPNAAIRGI